MNYKKRILIMVLGILCFNFVSINAQTSDVVSELTPVPKNAGKFSKKVPKHIGGIIENIPIEFDVNLETIILPESKTGASVTIQTSNKNLVFETVKSGFRAKVQIFVRIFSTDRRDEKIDGTFEETFTSFIKGSDIKKVGNESITLQRLFELPKGKYKIGIIVRDWVSGCEGRKLVEFQIP